MSAPQEWESTLAGLVRRAAAPGRSPVFPPAPPGVGHIGPVEPGDIESRRAEREVFERAWADVLSVQRQIVHEGWPGQFINLPDTRPAVLKAMDAAVIASKAVVEVAGPGESLSAERAAHARFEAAQERQDAPRTVVGPT